MTTIVRIDRDRPNPADIDRAAACLRRGGLVAFPTETVYGLGVHALDRDAVLRLFAAKVRPANDPLIVHVAAFDQIRSLVSAVPDCTTALASRWWPGPLTLVLPRAASVPDEVTAGLATVAIRIPAHPVALALLEAASIPVAAPSANLFSRPSPTRASHVLEDLDGRIEMVLDGGPTDVGVESTVLDVTADPPRILRPGAVTLEALRTVHPAIQLASIRASGEPQASPGLLEKHYAPRAPLTLFKGPAAATRDAFVAAAREAAGAGTRVGVLATSGDVRLLEGLPLIIAELGGDGAADEAAARLYAGLRDLDAERVEVILARDFPHDAGLWRALNDRLRRAAAQVVFVD